MIGQHSKAGAAAKGVPNLAAVRKPLHRSLWLRWNAMIGQHSKAGAAAKGVPNLAAVRKPLHRSSRLSYTLQDGQKGNPGPQAKPRKVLFNNVGARHAVPLCSTGRNIKGASSRFDTGTLLSPKG